MTQLWPHATQKSRIVVRIILLKALLVPPTGFDARKARQENTSNGNTICSLGKIFINECGGYNVMSLGTTVEKTKAHSTVVVQLY